VADLLPWHPGCGRCWSEQAHLAPLSSILVLGGGSLDLFLCGSSCGWGRGLYWVSSGAPPGRGIDTARASGSLLVGGCAVLGFIGLLHGRSLAPSRGDGGDGRHLWWSAVGAAGAWRFRWRRRWVWSFCSRSPVVVAWQWLLSAGWGECVRWSFGGAPALWWSGHGRGGAGPPDPPPTCPVALSLVVHHLGVSLAPLLGVLPIGLLCFIVLSCFIGS
jgi:hypothetical protein